MLQTSESFSATPGGMGDILKLAAAGCTSRRSCSRPFLRLSALMHVHPIVVVALCSLVGQGTLNAQAKSAADPNMERALRVLRASPVMDGHNDLPWRIREDSVHPHDVDAYDLATRTPGMTDIARLKAGHVGAQF